MALTDNPPTTTNYSIELPTVNGSRNVWGNTLNNAMNDLATNTFNAADTLGSASDSATPSLAYQLTQAVANASTAATNSATARDVAVKLVNNYLVALVTTINSLDTTSVTTASNASTAKSDALSAKTTAEGLV